MLIELLLAAGGVTGPAPLEGGDGIAGWVHHADGSPAAEERLLILGPQVRTLVTTNGSGMFLVPKVPEGGYQVLARGGRAFAQVTDGGAAVVELSVYGEWLPAKAIDAPEASAARDVPEGLRFEIWLPRRTFLKGEPIAVEGRFVNSSPRSVTMVREVDGSESGLRSPKYTVRVLDHDRRVMVPRASFGLCGTVNPFHPEDFFELKPGGIANPFEAATHWRTGSLGIGSALPTGRYSVSVTYTYDGEKAAERIAGLQSNVLELDVTDSPAAAGIPTTMIPPDWRLPLTRVHGRVVRNSSKAIAHVFVNRTMSVVNASGDYELWLPPGRYELRTGWGRTERKIVDVRGDSVKVDFR